MKKLIAFLLMAALCIGLLPATAFAESAQFLYNDEEIQELYYDFEYVSSLVETIFTNEDNLAYWNYAKEKEDQKVASWLIGMSNKIIGEEPDEKYYAQLLTNMIAMFEFDMAQQIEKQGQYDNMKNIKEYALDLVDIGTTAIGMQGKVEGLEKVIKTLGGAVGLLVQTTNEVKYYELTIRNYANAENFLKAVSEYSDNELLSKAAYELRTANELLLKERVTCINNSAGNLGAFMADSFLSDFSFALLKNTDAYKNDSLVKDYVTYGESAYKALENLISTGKVVFKTVMMGGDILFGTTNTFRRHNEMMAMADIAEALIAAADDITVSGSAPSQTIYSNVRAKCEYYKMLLATHLRGEYLIYSLNQNDAGVLSAISRWVDEHVKKEDQTVKKWYNAQADRCEEYYNIVNGIFDRLMKQKFVVHNGFELHDGFIVEIEKQTTVPEGYIGVYSFEDFKRIADSCPSDASITSVRDGRTEWNTSKYILMNDITMPAEYDSAGVFYGVLDGNGYTMHNVSVPLFVRVADATVKNLGLEVSYDADLEDNECNYGAVARYPYYFSNKNGVVFDNCFVKGNVSISCRSGQFGGFIGTADGVDISNCYNEANIRIKVRQSGRLGGICADDASVTNCYNTGDLSLYATCENTFNPVSIDLYVGGIKGYNYADAIRNCYNTGNISATSAIGCHVYTGGILGINYSSVSNAYIENCYNIGRVTNECEEAFAEDETFGGVFTPSYYSGGIVGFAGNNTYLGKNWNSGDVSSENFAGGIIGSFYSDDDEAITNCYNTGSISAPIRAGGILGWDEYEAQLVWCYNVGIVTGAEKCGALVGESMKAEENLLQCYYLDNGVGATGTGVQYSGVKALSESQLADPASFEGFDFLNVWKLHDGDTMPLLKQ